MLALEVSEKNSEAKNECITNHSDIDNAMNCAALGTKRKWNLEHVTKRTTHEDSRKISRETARNIIKIEIENEEHNVIPT